MGPQATLWFTVAVVAAGFGLVLLWQRYVRRDDRAVRSGGGSTLFAVCMIAFAVGSAIAGYAAIRAGR